MNFHYLFCGPSFMQSEFVKFWIGTHYVRSAFNDKVAAINGYIIIVFQYKYVNKLNEWIGMYIFYVLIDVQKVWAKKKH